MSEEHNVCQQKSVSFKSFLISVIGALAPTLVLVLSVYSERKKEEEEKELFKRVKEMIDKRHEALEKVMDNLCEKVGQYTSDARKARLRN